MVDTPISGNRLLAGEVNCPPGDSTGCDGMGRYGTSILAKGPSYAPSERGVNWEENGVRRAFDFNLAEHQARFDDAVRHRKNPTDGNLVFMTTPLGGPITTEDTWAMRGFLKSKGRKVKQDSTLGIGANEIVERNKKSKDRCASCGKQAGSNASLKLFDCTRCYQVAYCGKRCQRHHWKQHKKVCRPMDELE